MHISKEISIMLVEDGSYMYFIVQYILHLLQIIFRRIEGSDETPSEGATRTTNVRISGIEFFTWAKDNSMPGAMHELQTKQK